MFRPIFGRKCISRYYLLLTRLPKWLLLAEIAFVGQNQAVSAKFYVPLFCCIASVFWLFRPIMPNIPISVKSLYQLYHFGRISLSVKREKILFHSNTNDSVVSLFRELGWSFRKWVLFVTLQPANFGATDTFLFPDNRCTKWTVPSPFLSDR